MLMTIFQSIFSKQVNCYDYLRFLNDMPGICRIDNFQADFCSREENI